MYTMKRRTFPITVTLLAAAMLSLAGCGDDSGGGASGKCPTPGMQSTPTMAGNPCPTNHPACPSGIGKMAVTMCGADGVWLVSKPMGTCVGCGACECLPIGCGDGVMGPGEACDPKAPLPATATCMAMGKGTGTVRCNPLTCTFDVTMCVAAPTVPVGGAGGTSGM